MIVGTVAVENAVDVELYVYVFIDGIRGPGLSAGEKKGGGRGETCKD